MRQFIIGRLRALTPSIPADIFQSYRAFFDVTSVLDTFFSRECSFDQNAYGIATAEECQADLEWARNRPHVLLRYDLDNLAKEYPKHVEWAERFKDDSPGSWEAALTCRERWYLSENRNKVLDLGQSGKPIVGVTSEDLFTLLSGMGLVWNPDWKRPYHPLELLASQGWPIDDVSVQAAGVACVFSRSYASPNPARSRSSQCHQVGNAMHVSTIGSVLGAVLLRHPEIFGGAPTAAASASSASSGAPVVAAAEEPMRSPPAIPVFNAVVGNLRALKRRKS